MTFYPAFSGFTLMVAIGEEIASASIEIDEYSPLRRRALAYIHLVEDLNVLRGCQTLLNLLWSPSAASIVFIISCQSWEIIPIGVVMRVFDLKTVCFLRIAVNNDRTRLPSHRLNSSAILWSTFRVKNLRIIIISFCALYAFELSSKLLKSRCDARDPCFLSICANKFLSPWWAFTSLEVANDWGLPIGFCVSGIKLAIFTLHNRPMFLDGCPSFYWNSNCIIVEQQFGMQPKGGILYPRRCAHDLFSAMALTTRIVCIS